MAKFKFYTQTQENIQHAILITVETFFFFFFFLFTQDSLFSTYCTIINEGPAIAVLIVHWKLPFELWNSLCSIRKPRRNRHPWGSHAGLNSHPQKIQTLDYRCTPHLEQLEFAKIYSNIFRPSSLKTWVHER